MVRPSGRLRVAKAVVILALLGAGCGGMVPIGSECADFAVECAPSPPLDGGHDAGQPEADAATEGELDAGEPLLPDAGQGGDAGAVLFPGIQNGGFAITSVPPEPGDVSLLGGDAEIAPWRWCAGSVRVGPELGGRRPTEGDSLLSMAFGAGPAMIGQELSEPLEPGRRYALLVDVSRSDVATDDPVLELLGTGLTCTSPETLAVTPELSTGEALVTYCLRFTPRERHSYLTLRVSPLTAILGTVYVDNLRPAGGACP